MSFSEISNITLKPKNKGKHYFTAFFTYPAHFILCIAQGQVFLDFSIMEEKDGQIRNLETKGE